MKIVHHMQCRTSHTCTCVASSSVITTITLIELFTCQHIQICQHYRYAIYMPTHTDMPALQICSFLQEQLSHMRAYRIRKNVQRYRNAKKMKAMQRKIS